MVAACDRRPGPAVAACLALEAHDVGRGLRSLASTACAPGRPQSIGGGAMRGLEQLAVEESWIFRSLLFTRLGASRALRVAPRKNIQKFSSEHVGKSKFFELRDALLPALLPRVAQLNNTTRIVRNGVGSALLIRYSSHESRETGPAPGRPPDRSPHASSRSSLHPLTLSAHCDDDFMKPRACGAARPRAQSSGRGRRAPPAARRTCARGGRARAARQLRVAVAVGGGGGVAALGGDLRLRRRRGRRGCVQAVREAGGARAAPRESAARRGRAAGCAYPCAVTGES